jgi:RNA 2',3'-cyclic 3'-phosphodiesterase
MPDIATSAMKRIFAAIRIQPGKEFLNSIRSLRESLRPERIKWVEEHNIHITLKFFGETEEARIPAISASLRKIAAGTESFSLSLKNLGIFGSSYDPRVIWIGIEPYKELAELMKVIRDEMIPLGFPADRQNLVPHLTLGRIKEIRDKAAFQRSVDRFKTLSTGEMQAGSIILFESILKKEGPTYVALDVFPFRK